MYREKNCPKFHSGILDFYEYLICDIIFEKLLNACEKILLVICNRPIPGLKSYYAQVILDLNIRDIMKFFLYIKQYQRGTLMSFISL